jgi:hypothetical protein
VKHLRIQFLLLLLALVYCSAMRPVGEVGTMVDSQEHAPQRYSFCGPSGLFLHHTAPSESVVPVVEVPAGTKGNERHPYHAATEHAHVRTVRSAFGADTLLAGGERTAQRRWRILFPFHGFW